MTAPTQRIEAQQLSPDSWRLRDRTMPECDADALIAYVEQWGNHVEVVWLRTTGLPSHFESLDELLSEVERERPHQPALNAAVFKGLTVPTL